MLTNFSIAGTDEAGQNLPLGYLFSTMMFAVMIGSLTFQALERQSSSSRVVSWFTQDRLLIMALTLASLSFGAMVYDESTAVG